MPAASRRYAVTGMQSRFRGCRQDFLLGPARRATFAAILRIISFGFARHEILTAKRAPPENADLPLPF